MTSDKDDLEHALQENLRLRRELGGAARKVSRGAPYRVGWVLYWVCLVAIAAWLAYALLFHAYPMARDQGLLADGLFALVVMAVLYLVLPVFVLYALGRALRKVLSGE